MALPMTLVVCALMLSGVQASDITDGSEKHGSLSKYPLRSGYSKSSIGDTGKFMAYRLNHMQHGGRPEASWDHAALAEEAPTTPTVGTFMTYSDKPAHLTAPTQDTMGFTPAKAGTLRTSKVLKPQKIADMDEDKDLQKLFTSESNMLIGLSAKVVVLLSCAAMVVIRMWRAMRPTIALASSGKHGVDMSIPMVPVSVDNTLDLKSQGSPLRISEQVRQGSERTLAKEMHADIKCPLALWDPFGFGKAEPEAHVQNFRQSELHHGRAAMAAIFFVSPVSTQKPRPMHTLMLARERENRIRNAQDAGEIHDMIADEELDKFDSVAAVVQLSKMGRGSVGGGKKWVLLHDLVQVSQRHYGPRQTASVLHSYAKLRRRRLAISLVPLAELEEAVERVAPDMNSRHVAMTIWAYGALGVPPSPHVIDKLEAALRRVVSDMIVGGGDPLIPQGLANIIWAYSKLSLRPTPATLDALKQVAESLIRKMSPQEVANTLYGYAALPRTVTYDSRDTAMSEVPLAELEEAIERVAPDMNSQEVANTIWAYGILGVPPTRRVIDEFEKALRRVVTDMIPQEFSNIIWAYPKFGLRPMPETLDALKQVAGGLIRKMSPREVATTLYGYAALPRTVTYDTRVTAVSGVPLVELEEAIVRVALDMNRQEVENTIWAYKNLMWAGRRRDKSSMRSK